MSVVDLLSPDVIKKILLRHRTVHANNRHGHLSTMHYRAPNGRRFNVYEEQAGYYICEAIPNGRRMRMNPNSNSYVYWDDQRLADLLAKDDPNGFQKGTQDLKIRDNEIVRAYEVVSRLSTRHDTLPDAVEAIIEAISENRWLINNVNHKAYKEPARKPEEEDLSASELRFRQKIRDLERLSWDTEKDLFRGLFTMAGLLTDRQKKDILRYLEEPSRTNWKFAFDIPVKAAIPLWKAISLVEPEAPLMGPDASATPIPGSQMLRRLLAKIGEADAVELLLKAFKETDWEQENLTDEDDLKPLA